MYENTAGHAPIVHEGATLKSGTELPARPFMLVPIGEADLPGVMAAEYQGNGGSIAKAFRAATQQGQRAIKASIRERRWDWPRETQRSNGRTVGSPRDIVDSGELDSKQQPVRYE